MAPIRSPLGSLGLIAKLIDLGDQRLNVRAVQMLVTCLSSAKSSLTSMFGETDKDQKGAQRLLSNDHVDPLQLREVAYASTLHRIADEGLKRVVCAYDPTLMDFSRQEWKQERMPIGDGNGMGYEWLNAMLLDPRSKRLLGPLHQTLVSKSGPDDAHRFDYTQGITDKKLRKKLLLNPANQFLTIASAVDTRVPAGVEVIHVADREFDDGLTLRSRCKSAASHFVIRGNDNRVVQIHSPEWLPATLQKPDSNKQFEPTPEDLVNVHLKDLVRLLPCSHSSQMHLDPRGRVCVNSENASRMAELSVGAVAIRLARMSNRGETFKIPEEPVWLNLVVVREDAPPAGKSPIQWLLLTDLPVVTPDDLDAVIAIYGCRWRIEEFFRTVKDAMGIEKSELDDPLSTARLLFYTTLRAVFLDELRAKAEIPAGTAPTKEQRQEMVRGAERAIQIERARRDKNTPPPKLTTRERARMALGLIARHGRWTAKSKVSLGNYVLLSGLRIFLYDLSEQRYAWLLEDVG